MSINVAKRLLRRHASCAKAEILRGFFKTGPGQYGEGDVFIGVTVPNIRKVAGQYADLKRKDLSRLLKSEVHEERLLSLLILVRQYQTAANPAKKEIFDFYLAHTSCVNNWDLVDLTAPNIAGDFLRDKTRGVLYVLAKSKNLWRRRISIVSTLAFIREGDFADTFKIAGVLLSDKEELIHKACGWMLREAGKRDRPQLEKFLQKYYRVMPRTMLRYSIERLPHGLRQSYLKGII